MTKAGQTFYYDFCNTSVLGIYTYDYFDIAGNVYVNDFEITATGKDLTTAKATSYIIILFISLLIFVGLLWMGLGLHSKNKSDEMTGYVIAVSNIKYLKYLFLGFSYLCLVWISYFSWMIVYAYLDFNFLSNILFL